MYCKELRDASFTDVSQVRQIRIREKVFKIDRATFSVWSLPDEKSQVVIKLLTLSL
jgi:hypothetical protein